MCEGGRLFKSCVIGLNGDFIIMIKASIILISRTNRWLEHGSQGKAKAVLWSHGKFLGRRKQGVIGISLIIGIPISLKKKRKVTIF